MTFTIKVTRKVARLLDLMLDAHRFRSPTTGVTAMKEGVGPGSFYPLIARLESAGWVRAEWEDLPEGVDRPRRRFYYLTADGVQWAQEAVSNYESRPPWWKRLGTRG